MIKGGIKNLLDGEKLEFLRKIGKLLIRLERVTVSHNE